MSIGRPWSDTGRFRSNGDGRLHTLSRLGNKCVRKQAQCYGQRNERAVLGIIHEVCNISFLPYCRFGEIVRKTEKALQYELENLANTVFHPVFPHL